MDIFRFINSKDIREHLRSIGYEFNSLEAAWLIYQCHDATIDEKHKAWNELIETMPDCPIEKRLNTVAQDSLHAFLRQYIELEDRYLNEFCDERHADTFNDDKPFVYKIKYIYEDGTENGWDTVFSCLNALYESIMEPEEDVTSIQCTKMQIDRLDSRQIAYLNPSFEFLRLDPGRIDSDKEWVLFGGVFDGLWFEFPTPFQKGDIVWNPDQPEGFCAGPFVITGVCLDDIESDKTKENIRKDGDSSDMCAGGFFLNEDGSIYGECMSNYMDLEFYNKELTGSNRTLTALSNFLKDEIDPALFARAYHQIITAGYAENSIPLDYLKSGMILAGLSKPEHIKIWLDDVREAPEGYCHCHSVNEAKEKIIECEKEFVVIDEINCDHDLGDYASDGGDGIKLIDWLAERETYYPVKLHTMNPVGRENMQREIDRYWNNGKMK